MWLTYLFRFTMYQAITYIVGRAHIHTYTESLFLRDTTKVLCYWLEGYDWDPKRLCYTLPTCILYLYIYISHMQTCICVSRYISLEDVRKKVSSVPWGHSYALLFCFTHAFECMCIPRIGVPPRYSNTRTLSLLHRVEMV